jgi:single-stranded DNA-binding protein
MSKATTVITGNCVKDADIQSNDKGDVLVFTVAQNQYNGKNRDETTNYFECRKTGPGIQRLAEMLHKGVKVTVVGEQSIRLAEATDQYPAKLFLNLFAYSVEVMQKVSAPSADDPFA